LLSKKIKPITISATREIEGWKGNSCYFRITGKGSAAERYNGFAPLGITGINRKALKIWKEKKI